MAILEASTDRQILETYIRSLADALGLRDWIIILMDDPPDDATAAGRILPIYGRKRANLSLCAEFRELTPEEQRHIIIHELLHLHMESAGVVVREDLWENRLLSQGEYNATWSAFKHGMELGVDGITDAIAGFFPLIEWG